MTKQNCFRRRGGPAIISVLPFCALLLIPSRQVAAQGSGRDTVILPSITVTATRLDSSRAATTASSTILYGHELRRRGITTIGDAMRFVPGAAVVQSGSPGSETAVFLRGGERDFLQVLIDGVPVNEPGGFINLAHLSLDNVDRIEVVRGPVSVLYGSDAVAGVVQIFTRKGVEGVRRAELYAGAGSRNSRAGELSLSSGSSILNYSLGAAVTRSDGIYDLNNQHRNNSYSGAASLRLSSRARASFNTRLTDARYDYPTAFYGAPIDSNTFNSERRLSSGLNLALDVASNTEAVLDAGYTRQSIVTADPPDGGTPFPFDIRTIMQRRGAGARVNYRGIADATITAGVEYETQTTASAGGDTPAEDPLLERWTRSAFLQLSQTLGERVDLLAGARVDDNQRFGNFFTWRAGAGMRVLRNTRVRGAMGSGFREPQFLEISGGGFAKPNGSLQPERTLSGELAVEQSFWNSGALLSVTWFEQTFEDLIRFATLENDPDYFNQYQNFESATARGWEFEVRAALPAALQLSTSFTALSTRLEGSAPGAGSPLPRRPSRYGNATITWNAANPLAIDVMATYVGRRRDTRFFADFSSQQETLGGYARFDLAFRYALAVRALAEAPIDITARIDNVVDRRYEAVAGFEAPGRRFQAGLRVPLRF